MRSIEFLQEVHYEDIYPPAFIEFRKRYLKWAREGHRDLDVHFVQFTNYANNDKSANANPDHNDPIGVYAYPLKYVLTHPADIWYGHMARYARLLRSRATNVLYINDITDNQVVRILRTMGFDDPDYLLRKAIKHFPRRLVAPNKLQKAFMSVVQIDLNAEGSKDDYGNWSFPVRSGAEQTKLFRRAGYDAIRDTSRTGKQAVMNEREPEQIVFLTPESFDIVETIPLRPDEPEGLMSFESPEKRLEKPLVDRLLAVLEDRVTDGPERTNLGGWSYYWTEAGRRVEIKWERPSSYYRKKMGEKRHREHKLHNPFFCNLIIQTEYGPIQEYFTSDTKFATMEQSVAERWRLLKGRATRNKDWAAYTLAGYQQDVAREREERAKRAVDQTRAQNQSEIPRLMATLAALGQHFGDTFNPDGEPDDNLALVYFMEYFWNTVSMASWTKSIDFAKAWSYAMDGITRYQDGQEVPPGDIRLIALRSMLYKLLLKLQSDRYNRGLSGFYFAVQEATGYSPWKS